MTSDRFGIVGRVVASAYQVESVVAEGGFGVVYRAHHGGFRAPVALKCLKVPQQIDTGQKTQFLEKFRAEAEVMFRLSASMPAVVRPLHVDVMTTPNGSFVPFMVLEWLEGDTLDAIIGNRAKAGKRPHELAELIELLDPVARALERAHHFSGPGGAETIVHCDLKPENVFVAINAGERQVKVLDFGVAEVQRAATRATDATALHLFTPAYGAPEQWNPKALGATGPFTDVWGLALTLTEALVGRPVIAGDHPTLMAKILDPKRRPTPRSQGVVTSDAVDAVFERALAVQPSERYADAGVFWRALLEAHGRRAEASAAPSLAIPDLVPISRKPSGTHRLQLPSVQPLDFDGGDEHGPALALDVAPEDSVRRGSLAPTPARIGIADEPALLASTGSAGVQGPNGGARQSVPPTPPGLGLGAGQPALAAGAAPDAARRSSRPPGVLRPSVTPPPEKASLARRLVPGLAVVGGSVAVTLLDRVYASATTEVFSLGPIKAGTIAAILLVVGIALAARELFRES